MSLGMTVTTIHTQPPRLWATRARNAELRIRGQLRHLTGQDLFVQIAPTSLTISTLDGMEDVERIIELLERATGEHSELRVTEDRLRAALVGTCVQLEGKKIPLAESRLFKGFVERFTDTALGILRTTK